MELGALLSSHRGRMDNGLGWISAVFGLAGVPIALLPWLVERSVPWWVVLTGVSLVAAAVYLPFSGGAGAARRFDAFERGFRFSDAGRELEALWTEVQRVETMTQRKTAGLVFGPETDVALAFDLVTPRGRASLDTTMTSFEVGAKIVRDKISPLLPKSRA